VYLVHTSPFSFLLLPSPSPSPVLLSPFSVSFLHSPSPVSLFLLLLLLPSTLSFSLLPSPSTFYLLHIPSHIPSHPLYSIYSCISCISPTDPLYVTAGWGMIMWADLLRQLMWTQILVVRRKRGGVRGWHTVQVGVRGGMRYSFRSLNRHFL